MTTDTQHLDEVIREVEDMMQKQKNFFATRNANALKDAKFQEQKVRKLLERVKAERADKQTLRLWGDGK